MVNPRPTKTAASASQRPSAFSIARVTAQAPRVSSKTSKASGLLNRNMRVATGVRASASPASRPATGPNQRRTVTESTPTVATPSSACGTRIDHELTPNRRAERSMTQSDAGGLSTVMKLAASEEPKKKAFQLWAPA